jgi:hypothetical protein
MFEAKKKKEEQGKLMKVLALKDAPMAVDFMRKNAAMGKNLSVPALDRFNKAVASTMAELQTPESQALINGGAPHEYVMTLLALKELDRKDQEVLLMMIKGRT